MARVKDKTYVVKIFVGTRQKGKWKIKGSEAEVNIWASSPKEALTMVGKMLTADSHPWGKETRWTRKSTKKVSAG